MSEHVVLFWDIDGTLLTTARAGLLAFEDAVREVVGGRIDLSELHTAGLTDAEVAAAALSAAAVAPDERLTNLVLRAYERHLPRCLPLRDGHVMPGVREVLEDFSSEKRVRSLLLTGNTPVGARTKLAHYGLNGYLRDGAFCVGLQPRTEVARQARRLVGNADEIYVVGDTPHDIAAGAAVQARTIAVATGQFSAEVLAQHGAWLVLERIPSPTGFRKLLSLA